MHLISYVAEYPSDEDLANLKHVTMTRNEPWMPHQYGPTHGEQWFDIQEDGKRKEQAQNAPHNNHEAMEYDLRNNNTRWAQSEEMETLYLSSLGTFPDLNKNITDNFTDAMKHDGRYKCITVIGRRTPYISVDKSKPEHSEW